MTTLDALTLAVVVGVAVLGRFIAIAWVRRIAVVCLRIGGLLCLLLALRGSSYTRRYEQPRTIVYLVDQSASIDSKQSDWIARRIASLEAMRPNHIPRLVLAFGEQSQMVFPSDRSPLADAQLISQALAASRINRDATNLEAALLGSLSAEPASERRRVILFSDGRQTVGSVERVLSYLRRAGLEVYPVVVPPGQPSGVVWSKLAVPPVVQEGSSIPIKLGFVNATAQTQTVEVAISSKGFPIARRRQKVPVGWQALTISAPTLKRGTMPLDISVATAGQSVPQARTAFVEVEGPPHILLVLDRPTELPLLATALKHRQIDLAIATPQELPEAFGGLLDYDAVLLFQVPKSSLSASQVSALEQYVRRLGGGIIMVGLGGKLSEEVLRESPLDGLLPVRFEPKGLQEAKRRVCIVMLIDRSASMMGPRIAATKRAAVELVKQLAPEDLVGVLAFDTMPYVIVEVTPARQVSDVLIDKLVRLKSTGGTDILPALRAAGERLGSSGATVKHIILLSDGNTPFDSSAYRRLLSELTQQRITVSTIGIGATFVNTELLEWLATRSGGTFYHMGNLDELPRLIARDTEKTLSRLPFSEGYFRPIRPEGSQWFEDILEWPSLKGYLTATAKPQAHVELAIRQAQSEDPLLAQWTIGRGRVAAFTSDADARWSAEWIRWPHFESVWAELVRQTTRPRSAEELFVWLDEQTDVPHMVIEGQLADPSAQLLSSDGKSAIPLGLIQESRFRWRSPVGHVESGWYQLVVESQLADASEREQDQPVSLARRWIQIGGAERLSEQANLAPDEDVLRRIAQATHGAMEEPDRAFLAPTDLVQTSLPLRGWLLPIALLLLLADVALRGRTML